MPSPTELWRYQGGGSESTDYLYGASVAADGSVFLAGSSSSQWNATSAGGNDFSAAKLDSDGNFLWAWQEGSERDDIMTAAAAVSDGGVVLAGYFNGTWDGVISQGEVDFAAVKLDSAGTVMWRWQTGTIYDDYLYACVETTDGNVVVAGHSIGSVKGTASAGFNDIVAVKLNVNNGEEIWTYQAGKSATGGTYAYAAAAREDGSIVLAGRTYGQFHTPLTTTDGYTDFAAVAIDENGTELWRWQDGAVSGWNRFSACTALDDGSVILGGYTEGDWNGTNKGGYDFAVVKLSALGEEEWRRQNGTALHDQWAGAATTIDGSIVLAGYTEGAWAGTQDIRLDEVRDFAAMAMDDEGLQLWSYQDGTDDQDDVNAVAVGPDGSILLAGWTDGTWTTTGNTDLFIDYAVVIIDGSELTIPSPQATTSSTGTPSSTRLTPTPTPGPSSTVGPNSSPSGTSSAFTIGGAAAGGVFLVILGVLLCRRSRRSTNVATKTSSPVESRQYPAAAPADGPMPPPPSYSQMVALRS